MTQQPPPYDPYLSYAAVPLSPRPGVVSVLAIIGIVEASLGLLCLGFGLIAQVFALAMGTSTMFGARMNAGTAVTVYGIITAVINLLLCIALLWLCILALKLRPFARRAMMQWSIVAIILATIETAAQIAWVGPVTMAAAAKMQQSVNPAGAQFVTSLGTAAQMAGAILGWIIECTLPVLVLTLWRSPEVCAAFAEPALPPQP